MTVRLHDTLTGQTRELVPLRADRLGIYSCGPTVYGPAHIGNFRSFLFGDLLVRHLRWRGFPVTWVMNITDIDDKIIRGAAAEGIGIGELAERHLDSFLADATALRMTTPDVLPRATAYIDQMVTLIETLLRRGHAYRTDDGSIFFRIASWPAYGRLARLDPDGMRVGERVEADEYGKDDVRDFALWKGPRTGEPAWETAIGAGRPGWHIECSAMSMAHLGPSFDIHTGGVDLIFPHHEDEIAQSEAATGQPFVATWLHCAHLQMGGAKMAKSSGNFARVGDLLGAGVSPRALRLALISVHYRAGLSHSDESLVAAAAAVERLDAAVAALRAYREDAADDATLPAALDAARETFGAALDDDLNVSAALRLALISVHYRAGLSHSDESLVAAAAAIERLDAAVAALRAYREDAADDATLPAALDAARETFGAALDDDLNVSAALGATFDLVRELNRRIERRSLSTADASRAIDALRDLDRVLAVLPDDGTGLDYDTQQMLEAREAARAAREWATSDRLRDELAARGITVEDTRDGQRWRRAEEVVHG